MRVRSLILTLAALAFAALAPAAARAVAVDGIAAVVNGDIVTIFELEKAAQAALAEGQRLPPPTEAQARREALRPLLEQLVLQRLQAQRARELGIQVSEQEVDAAIAGVLRENSWDEGMLDRLLRERGLAREEYRREIHDQVLLQKLVRQEIGTRTTATDAEVEAYFEAHRQEWRRPEKIRVRHLLVPLPGEPSPAEVEAAAAKAAALRAKVDAGADFADLVRAETPGAAPGVDPVSGEIARGELFPALELAAFSLPVGGVSQPVRGPAGFHIVQVAEKNPAYEPTLAEMRPGIEVKLIERKARERFGEWLKQLRSTALIEIRY